MTMTVQGELGILANEARQSVHDYLGTWCTYEIQECRCSGIGLEDDQQAASVTPSHRVTASAITTIRTDSRTRLMPISFLVRTSPINESQILASVDRVIDYITSCCYFGCKRKEINPAAWHCI